MHRQSHIMSAFVLLCMLLAGVSGCGKKGDPSIPGENRQFAFTRLDATLLNECIQIQGSLSGSWWNLEQIYVEVQPSDILGNCDNCPFLPTEQAAFTASDVFAEWGNGKISLQFCPMTSSSEITAWRWRLIGKNMVRDLPYVLTPVQIVRYEK